jgi:hypothetical protein
MSRRGKILLIAFLSPLAAALAFAAIVVGVHSVSRIVQGIPIAFDWWLLLARSAWLAGVLYVVWIVWLVPRWGRIPKDE